MGLFDDASAAFDQAVKNGSVTAVTALFNQSGVSFAEPRTVPSATSTTSAPGVPGSGPAAGGAGGGGAPTPPPSGLPSWAITAGIIAAVLLVGVVAYKAVK